MTQAVTVDTRDMTIPLLLWTLAIKLSLTSQPIFIYLFIYLFLKVADGIAH